MVGAKFHEQPRLASHHDPKGEWNVAPPPAGTIQPLRSPEERLNVLRPQEIELLPGRLHSLSHPVPSIVCRLNFIILF